MHDSLLHYAIFEITRWWSPNRKAITICVVLRTIFTNKNSNEILCAGWDQSLIVITIHFHNACFTISFDIFSETGLVKSQYLIKDKDLSVQSSPVSTKSSVDSPSSSGQQSKLTLNLGGSSVSVNIVKKIEEIDKIAAAMSCGKHESTMRNNVLTTEVKVMERWFKFKARFFRIPLPSVNS